MIGVVEHFGIQQGVGVESLSVCCKAIHIDTHLGCSPTALRHLKHRVEAEIVDDGSSAQAESCPPTESQGVWLGADEPFFGLQDSAAGGLSGHPGVTRQRSPLAQAGPMWLTEIGSRALPSISTPGP